MKALLALALVFVFVPVVLTGVLLTPSSAPACSSSCGAASSPFRGPDGLVDDPTTRGQITRRMLHTLTAARSTFNGWPDGVTCWDPHTWNPTSDHPRGRACDFTVGQLGTRPSTTARAQGWKLALWARTNALALGISYVIWDGHIWSTAHTSAGWRAYNGGGIYDPTSVTGGHYDHVHISVR